MRIPHKELMPFLIALLRQKHIVKITIRGSSMVPFLFPYDTVWIQRRRECLPIGTIVLFEYRNGVFALHRIVRRLNDQYWIRGDAQNQTIGPIDLPKIYGEVIQSVHHGRIRYLNHAGWRLAGLAWLLLYPIDRLIFDWLLCLRKALR